MNFLAILLTIAQPPAATPVKPAPTLTLDAAVASASRNHPSLRVADANRDRADAKIDQNRAALRPKLDANMRMGSSMDGDLRGGSGAGVTGRTSYNAGIGISWLVYDFGKTNARIAASRASADAAKYDVDSAQQDVVLDARVAYLKAVAAKELVDVARQNLRNEQRHYNQVKAFVDIGTRPKVDLARQQTLVATAEAALAKAENDYDSAKAALNVAMGKPGSIAYDVIDPALGAVSSEFSTTKALYEEALSNRPEIAASKAAINAQKLGLSATKKSLRPSLRASADASIGGSDLDRTSWGGSVGLVLSIPLFDGGDTAARTKADTAGLIAMEAQMTALEQNTWLAVEQARLAVRSAKAQVLSTTKAHDAAKELLTLAEGRYNQGAGDAIELADAQLQLNNAASRKIAAQLDLATARAKLLRVLGRIDWT